MNKPYWDSSALVLAFADARVRARLEGEGGHTRPHALAEVFSTLTGGRLGYRLVPKDAAELCAFLTTKLELVDLEPDQVLATLATAQAKGVRGGRIHDLLHAATAAAHGCKRLLTLNHADFQDLEPTLAIEPP